MERARNAVSSPLASLAGSQRGSVIVGFVTLKVSPLVCGQFQASAIGLPLTCHGDEQPVCLPPRTHLASAGLFLI